MRDAVALETTLLAHGVPRAEGLPLFRELTGMIERHGVSAAAVGVLRGRPVVGLTELEIAELLATPDLPKANTSNLGILMHRGVSAATTVSTTMELASGAGLRVFATGGLGGVHRGYGTRLDISSDLAALARFPVAVVASGVKSILDVESTRELLETLGIPVVGLRTDAFPAFYRRDSGARVDARIDSVDELAAFVASELRRSGRGILICNPIPHDAELDGQEFARWLAEAETRARHTAAAGRDVTPQILAALHQISGGATLRANLSLVRSNAGVAARLCAAMRARRSTTA